MPKTSLTDKAIQRLPQPKSGRVDYVDANNRGLALRVSHTGDKAWSVLYRVLGEGGVTTKGRELRGKQKRISLGTYPAISLAEAREKAQQIKRLADTRVDPRNNKDRETLSRHNGTVEKVAKLMVDLSEIQTVDKMRSNFRDHICPTIGSRPMAEIELAHINVLLDTYVAKGRAGTAREMKKYLTQLWGFAHQRGIVQANIMLGMRRKDISYKPRSRTLTDDELKVVWSAAQGLRYPYGPLIQLLMLTGLRKNEVARATWDEIDENRRGLLLPADRTKTAEPILAPFSDQAWDILQSLPRFNGPHIFTTTGGRVPMTAGSKLANMLNTACGVDVAHFTLHDLRRTLRTRLPALGVTPDIAERVIGHKPQGVIGTYDLYAYIPERREAVNRYAHHLQELVDG